MPLFLKCCKRPINGLDEDLAVPIQHDVNAPITETTALGRHQLHSRTYISVIRPDAAVSHARPVDGQNFARATLAQPHSAWRHGQQRPASHRASPFFQTTSFKNGIIQHGLGQQLLQLGVLVFQSLQLGGIGNLHTPELRLVLRRSLWISLLAADIGRPQAVLLIFQYSDHRLIREP
ncbi:MULTISPECIES: hypothetical protein [unclassified Rhizobium]|uniref:hypothetical protein n=1 Tax=unclassified Rhizobium TaxID=2613769 RepID=UPI001AE5F537|nr:MULTISPECIES: hypothetical protein [unclassified Rhizobium]MBP2463618.1 hypothetical protein [Rhizobium sp. PvP014]MBP2532140.1 hypothetical protein [Rhizobium sp. PvP099]